MDLSSTALVVAHPDDEVLWFSSLVTKVARIVMCYGTISPSSQRAKNRRNAVANYPFNTVEFIELPIPPITAADSDAAYQQLLTERLATALRGTNTVFTHNSWGEYGQPDHRRVYAAVASLRADMGFALYVSCYAARHQRAEIDRAVRSGVGGVMTRPIPHRDVEQFVAFYRQYECWTWTSNWIWPHREHFLALSDGETTLPVPIHLFGSSHRKRAEMRAPWRNLLKTRTTEISIPIATSTTA